MNMLNALYVLKNELSEKKRNRKCKTISEKLLIKRNSKNYVKH